jgi:ABC-type transporter Mla subunit MlaD
VVSDPILSEPTPVKSGRPTAAIIAFPVRPKPVAPRPEERLARALDSLNTAMTDQRAAVAAWREVLGELKATTTGLDESLQRYRSNLRSLSGSVLSLHAKARALEQWADSIESD